jgi:DNA-directed RNA polymerase alpha subunit
MQLTDKQPVTLIKGIIIGPTVKITHEEHRYLYTEYKNDILIERLSAVLTLADERTELHEIVRMLRRLNPGKTLMSGNLAGRVSDAIRVDILNKKHLSMFSEIYEKGDNWILYKAYEVDIFRKKSCFEASYKQKLPIVVETRAGCFPFIKYNSEKLDELNSSFLDFHITRFSFSVRTKNVLLNRGIQTLGDLIELLRIGEDAGKWINLGKTSYKELVDFILALDDCIASDGRPNWTRFSSLWGNAEIGEEESSEINCEAPVRIEFPFIRFTTPSLQHLSEKCKEESLDNLHLDCRAYSSMHDLGVITVGDFVSKMSEGINANDLRNVGRKAFQDLCEAIRALSLCIDSTGKCDWTKFAENRGFGVFPNESLDSGIKSAELLINSIRKAITAQFLDHKDRERYSDILDSRVIAKFEDVRTLEALGGKYNVSRELIRQNEAEIIRYLRASVLEGCYSVPKTKNNNGVLEVRRNALRYRFRPELQAIMKKSEELFASKSFSVSSLADWSETFAVFSGFSEESIRENAHFLTLLLGFQLVPFNIARIKSEPLVVIDSLETELINQLRDFLEDLHLFLQDKLEPESYEDIFATIENSAILERLGLDPEYFLSLCSTIEETTDGLWKIKPEHYRPRIGKLSCDIVEKILREKGNRIHSSDIVRKFRRSHEHLLENDRALMARMFNDDRFEPIGRTGYWVLKEWGLETGTIREVLPKVLSSAPGPMHLDDIIAEVRRMIPCAASSVEAYLQEAPEKYTKLGPRTYCLAGREPEDTF